GFLRPVRIMKDHGIVRDIAVQVQSALNACRICGGPASEPRRVITGADVVKARLFVPLLARVTVTFGSHLAQLIHCLVTRAAEGIELLVRNDLRRLIGLETSRPEMVGILVADDLRLMT